MLKLVENLLTVILSVVIGVVLAVGAIHVGEMVFNYIQLDNLKNELQNDYDDVEIVFDGNWLFGDGDVSVKTSKDVGIFGSITEKWTIGEDGTAAKTSVVKDESNGVAGFLASIFG